MKKKTQNVLGFILAATLVIIPMSILGHYEFEEDVLNSIPEAVYEEIASSLGDSATNAAIVEYYIQNREDYE